MLERLALWGLPKNPVLRETIENVPDRAAWPESLRFVDPRLGPAVDRATRTIEPSRRLSVLLADLLELTPGTSVLLPSQGFVYLRALVESTEAEVCDTAHAPAADRVLRVEPAPPTPINVAPDGFTLRLDVRPGQEALEKILSPSVGGTTLGLVGLKLGEGVAGAGPRSVKHLLELEGLEIRALARQPLTKQDRHFAEAVASTWSPPAFHDANLSPAERQRLEDARDFFHLGYIEQFAGDLVEAIGYYRASTELFPTAEAHTFLGWAYHFAGRVDQAIEECRRAILVDPDFGNPYNDVGAYLLELGKPREALEWLLKAETAPRYLSPHYAHCNAGRAYQLMGRPSEARQEFLRALEIAPGYAPAMEGLRKLSSRFGESSSADRYP